MVSRSSLYDPTHFPSAAGGPGFDLRPERHEQLLRNHPEKYSEMVRSVTGYGIYLIDRGGLISSWNQGAELITGYARGDVLGKHFETLFPDDSVRDGLPRRTLEFVRANRHSRDEQRRRRRSSGEFLAHSALDSVRAESGELLGFVEVFQDITEAKQREERLYERATRDPLTGVFNRGHFVEAAALEIERARRFSEPLSLLLIDIDRFKKINDTYGHDIGDRVIVALARMLVAEARKVDVVGRIGGEEFAVLLPRANKQPAAEIGQRLRRAAAAQRVAVGGGREIGFTVSLGLASLRTGTRDLAELMRNADAALYQAKREGRNRLEAWFE
ncbi:diguanylate cyclase [Fontimonas sp. SYSU GA230001]|uniref:GGDEF domain-containing protein n=1 Tax=Fontimonas sp. SYSU GA230001 TaxID=3142450 RepID=UPI0032B48A7D